jgi:hypothetical protein
MMLNVSEIGTRLSTLPGFQIPLFPPFAKKGDGKGIFRFFFAILASLRGSSADAWRDKIYYVFLFNI